MLRPLPLLLVAALALGGCARLADSRLNPLNWFGGARAIALDGSDRPLVPGGSGASTYDLRQPIAVITDMTIEPTSTGAILRATGTTPSQGWFNAQLVETARADGILTYEFRVEAPADPTPGAQTITVARTLTSANLTGISAIRVLAQSNALESRR